MKTGLRAALLVVTVAAAACTPSQPSPEYLAVCEGPPLKTLAQREQAMEDGYEIDRRFDCVTKRSAEARAEEQAAWAAANTPEAKAARQAEFDQRAAEGRLRLAAQAQAEAEADAERQRRWLAAEQLPVALVEINSATAAQLASLPGLDAELAQEIVAERAKRHFTDWADLIDRIVALSPAEIVVRVSAFGLTVNGRSFQDAEPDTGLARFARDKWRRRAG